MSEEEFEFDAGLEEYDEDAVGAGNAAEFTMWERLTGPLTSGVFHIIAIVLMLVFIVDNVMQDDTPEEQTFEVTPPAEEELEEIEEMIEELEEVEEDLPPSEFVNDFATELDVAAISSETTSTDPVEIDIQDISLVSDAPSPIVMKGLFANRSAAGRLAAVNAFGGGGGSEKAVTKALDWLHRNQIKDGDRSGTWETGAPTAMAGLGLLTFLAHGETPSSTKYGETVKRSIDYLIRKQKDNGAFEGGDGHEYTHAIATYAAAEAYAMTKHPSLKYVMDKGIGRIVDGVIIEKFPRRGSMQAIAPYDSGTDSATVSGGFWNYNYADGAYPNGFANNYMSNSQPMQPKISRSVRKDHSYAGFQIQALKAAKFAGCSNPKLNEVFELGQQGIKFMQGKKGKFAYSSQTSTPTTGYGTVNQLGVGAYCLYLGEKYGNRTEEGALAAKALYEAGFDSQANRSFYRIYYQANANFWVDGVKNGPTWGRYNAAFKPWLIKNQDKSGDPKKDGSWSHQASGQEDKYNLVYPTTLGALSLMVYYRNLPGSSVEGGGVGGGPVIEAPADIEVNAMGLDALDGGDFNFDEL